MARVAILFSICLMFASATTAAAQQTVQSAGLTTGESDIVPAQAPAFTVARMELCENVINRTPVDIGSSFPATQDKVYCYLEFKDVKKETIVNVVWTFGRNEMGKISLTLRPYAKFRTWANKSINGMKGDWKVAVVNDKGGTLRSAAFTVQ